MEYQLDMYGYMTNAPILILMMLLLVGIYVKTSSIIIKVLSYPTYLALYSSELFMSKKANLEKRHFFRLNLSLDSTKRFYMNIAATYVTVMTFLTVGMKINFLFSNPKLSKSFIQSIFQGTLIPNSLAISILVAILIIYIISWFSDIDTNKPYDKIEVLSIPSLWMKTLKS